MSESRELLIIDYQDNTTTEPATEQLPESFGYELDTIEKARRWLTNPKNWFKSELFILQWNGLVPSISEKHGKRLIAEPWDDGLPWCVVYEQRMLRTRKDEPELEQIEENDDV